MLLGNFAREASESLWRELGEEVIKSALNVLVEEGIEATVEVVKKRALKIQEEELDQRDFVFGQNDGADAGEGAGRESAGDETAKAATEESSDGISPSETVAEERETSTRIESLSRYAERHSPSSD